MNIFLDKVNYEIARAAEYLETNVNKQSEGYRVQIESIQDSVSLLYIIDTTKEPHKDDFSKVLADAQSMLEKLKFGLERAESEEKLAASTSPPNCAGVKATVPYDLVEIPKFRGDDPLEFRTFMKLFMNRINCSLSLTAIEKFILLKNHLEGDAYDVINEIPMTENTFSLSVSLLEEMYGDEEKCINALLDHMKTLPAASAGEIAGIRKTYWKMEAILRSLEHYGKPVNENRLLERWYLEKFANVCRLEVGDLSVCQLEEIREQMRHFIRAEERAESELVWPSKSSASNVESGFFTNEEEPSETASTHEEINSAPWDEILECIFCTGTHFSEDCTVYPTIYQRKLQIQHLCWTCLQMKHEKKRCERLEKCNYCDETSHHPVLCPVKCRAVAANAEASSERLSDTKSEDREPIFYEPSTEDSFYPTTPLTTCTFVEWSNSGKKTSVRLVIASGCPMSIISESAAGRLGMKYSSYEKSLVLVNVMGKMFKATDAAANVLIHLPNAPPFPQRLHVVEKVCDKTVVTPTVEEFKKVHPHLADMDFPDTGNGLAIDMLIGGDSELASFGFNRGLNGEECPRVNKGWSLVSSKFGWLIIGTDKSGEPVVFTFSVQK